MQQRVKEYLTYLADRKNISGNTNAAYARDLRVFTEYLIEHGTAVLEEVTPTTLNSYMIYLEKQGYGAATISRKTAVLRGFFLYLFKQGIMKEDVADMLEGPRMESKEPQRAQAGDIEKLISAIKGRTPREQRDRAMIEVLCCTGILIEELINLKVEDVRLDMGYVQCHFQKNQNAYPLNERSREALEHYLNKGRTGMLKGQDMDVLFPSTRGTAMSRQAFWKMIQKYARECNVKEKITPGMLRRL